MAGLWPPYQTFAVIFSLILLLSITVNPLPASCITLLSSWCSKSSSSCWFLTRQEESPFKKVPWFLNLSTLDILDWIILSHKGCPVHHRMSSSLPSLHPLDARSIPQPCGKQKHHQAIPNILWWGQNCPQLTTTVFNKCTPSPLRAYATTLMETIFYWELFTFTTVYNFNPNVPILWLDEIWDSALNWYDQNHTVSKNNIWI